MAWMPRPLGGVKVTPGSAGDLGDLGDPRHAEHYVRRSLDMDSRFVRGKAFILSLLRSARSVRSIRNLQHALRSAADAPAVREFSALVEQRLPAASARAARRQQ